MNFQCEKCLKIFKKKHHYIKHLNRKKKCYEIIKCTKCNKTFSTNQQLQNHLNRLTDCTKDLNNINNINNKEYVQNFIKELKKKISTLTEQNLLLKKELEKKDKYINDLNLKMFE